MKRSRFFIATALLLAFSALPAVANYIQITNVSIAERNDSEGYAVIQFDLSWENSFRTNIGDPIRDNWDAAWVFIKWIKTADADQDVAWSHAMLAPSGHNIPSNSHGSSGLTTFTHALGRPDENSPYNATTNPYVGVFIHPDAHGAGHVLLEGVQLHWDYDISGLNPTDQVDIKVFGIEMVYVPEGPFWLGGLEGGNGGEYYAHPNTNKPFRVESEDAFTLGCDDAGCLRVSYRASPGHEFEDFAPENDGVTYVEKELPALFPKGFQGFYSMKHMMTQQAYVDFINTLTEAQNGSMSHSTTEMNRHSLVLEDGKYSTIYPFVAKHNTTFKQVAAYAAWAGLRPMTDFEYEKAVKGPVYPVFGQYAWGTSRIASNNYVFENDGLYNEVVTSNYKTEKGNALWGALATYGLPGDGETAGIIMGPSRVGIFATENSNREQAGASYWGIHDMGGNLRERIIHPGRPEGRDFTGLHGNGSLSNEGDAEVAYWPGILNRNGLGSRGGCWGYSYMHLRAAFRKHAADNWVGQNRGYGFRAVRTAPKP